MARVVLVLLLAAAGCHVDLNDPGTEPLAAMFYYPAGILLDPDQKHLYVTNGNSDLKYGGGTVQMIDLPAFEAAVAQFRADPTVKNGCQVDPLDQMIVNCPEGPVIFAPDTGKVGNFADLGMVERHVVRKVQAVDHRYAFPECLVGQHPRVGERIRSKGGSLSLP